MTKTSTIVVALAPLLLSPEGALAQTQGQNGTGVVQGTVQAESGTPILGVTVTVLGTRLGAVTRPDGRYTITGVTPGTHQVRAQRLGYALTEQPVTVVSGETVSADFRMASVAVSLDEFVVVGYGTQRKRDLTGSVGSVSNADIATIPVPRVDQAIVGKIPGVQIQTTNAQPGSTLRIRVRGGNSLRGNNEPLVVVSIRAHSSNRFRSWCSRPIGWSRGGARSSSSVATLAWSFAGNQ